MEGAKKKNKYYGHRYLIKNKYNECKTEVRTKYGVTEAFVIIVGRHKGSDISPYLFDCIVDKTTKHIHQETPQVMLFADNLILINEAVEEL